MRGVVTIILLPPLQGFPLSSVVGVEQGVMSTQVTSLNGEVRPSLVLVEVVAHRVLARVQ